MKRDTLLILLLLLVVGVALVLSHPANKKKKPKSKKGSDDDDDYEDDVVEKVRGTGDYCYEEASCGPESWTGSCKRGSTQSPVNIDFKPKKSAKSIDFHLDGLDVEEFLLQNDGHALLVHYVPTGGEKASFFQGGGLSEIPYKFAHAVFRWGTDEDTGSEHTINGQAYSMEVQLVHYNPKYENVEAAIKSGKNASIAIVSTFLEVDPNVEPSESLAPILKNLQKVLKPQPTSQSWIKIPDRFDIDELIPDESPTIRIIHYSGSLTTPNCDELVEWFLFSEPSPVAPSDVAAFRKLTDGDGLPIKKNIRPIQRGGKNDRSTLPVQIFELKGITKEDIEIPVPVTVTFSNGTKSSKIKIKIAPRKKLKSLAKIGGKLGRGIAGRVISSTAAVKDGASAVKAGARGVSGTLGDVRESVNAVRYEVDDTVGSAKGTLNNVAAMGKDVVHLVKDTAGNLVDAAGNIVFTAKEAAAGILNNAGDQVGGPVGDVLHAGGYAVDSTGDSAGDVIGVGKDAVTNTVGGVGTTVDVARDASNKVLDKGNSAVDSTLVSGSRVVGRVKYIVDKEEAGAGKIKGAIGSFKTKFGK